MRKKSGLFMIICTCFFALFFYTNAGALNITVTIITPETDSSFQPGETITFSGSGLIEDSEENLTGGDLVWNSSRDGRIGIGTFFTTNTLSTGHHWITLVAQNLAVASIEIDVKETVSISYPADGDTFQFGETIDFIGEGLEFTSGDLVWVSSQDGQIGTGPSFSTSVLSAGHHRITLKGNQAIATIEIDVLATGTVPTPPITSGKYATYNMASNTLFIPYSPVPGTAYWVNMGVISFIPFELEIKGIGEATYDPTIAYATFNLFTNTVHVPDYRDTGGNSYWFNLNMKFVTDSITGITSVSFTLGGADLNP